MITLITGGSGSGKSAYAENIFVTRQMKRDTKKNITLPPCRYLMMRDSGR